MAQGIAGLILAGGAGRRWGGPKYAARLPDGRSFLEACLALLRAADVRPIAATLPPGVIDPALAPGADAVLVCPLPQAGLEMFDSIRIGATELLAAAGWEALLVLPVDHPLVHRATITALGARAAGIPRFATTYAAVLPCRDGRRGHPVLLSRALAAAIAGGAVAGPTLREAWIDATLHEVAVTDPGIARNLNHPEDLRGEERSPR